MRPAVLFDLGNTLVSYYHGAEFQPILRQSISSLVVELTNQGYSSVSFEAALTSAKHENCEASDFRFSPILDRLERIFGISLIDEPELAKRLCELFLDPIFAVGRVYDDSLQALLQLKAEGYQLAIVSNSPWGSPPELWHKELRRLGISELVDVVVFCGDVGWRKPAPQIFEHTAAVLGRPTKDCIFVGDDIRWDTSGSEAVGMRSILIDRDKRNNDYIGEKVESLDELLGIVVSST